MKKYRVHFSDCMDFIMVNNEVICSTDIFTLGGKVPCVCEYCGYDEEFEEDFEDSCPECGAEGFKSVTYNLLF